MPRTVAFLPHPLFGHKGRSFKAQDAEDPGSRIVGNPADRKNHPFSSLTI
jgi:hypothetical protein